MEKQLPPPYVTEASPLNPEMYPPGAPPGPGWQPSAEPTQHTVHTIVVNTSIAPAAFGPNPITLTCPYCQASVTTVVETEPNTKTHLMAVLLFAIGCWLCCCLPYCIDSCQSRKHYCPNCKSYLAEYKS